MVEKALGQIVVAVSQLQCSGKSARAAVAFSWKNHPKIRFLLHGYGLENIECALFGPEKTGHV